VKCLTLHYQEYGDRSATLILFIHGGGVSGWMWDKQIQHFTHYHCIVPILPEHGLNNTDINFTIKGSAEELVKLVEEKASGKKTILIGFSLGAQVIIQMLSMKPNLIDIAIINSALVKSLPLAINLIKPTITLTYPLIKKRWFSKLQAKTLYVKEGYFEKYYEESRQIKPETLVRVLKENMSFKIPKNFGEANGKMLVTVGEKENAIMINSAKAIIKANSNCEGVIVPNIGHGASLAMPDFFNHMIEAYIQKRSLPKECKLLR